MNKNNNANFWFFSNRELLDLIKELEHSLHLPNYYHNGEDTWEWVESDKIRCNMVEMAKKYKNDDELKMMFGSDYIKNSLNWYIDEKSNDLYFDMYREHYNGFGKYESPAILIMEKFPDDYTIEEINLIGKQICNILKVDVYFGFIEWNRDKNNGYKLNYEYNPSIIFKSQNINNI